MKLRNLLFLFLLVICVIEGIRARKFSSARWSSKPSSGPKSFGNRGSPSGGSHGTSFGTSHGTGISSGTSGKIGGTSHQQNKHLSTQLLHAEGGGATRPAQTNPPTTFGGSHSPSAPSGPYTPNGSPYGAFPPHTPSAPPVQSIPKVTSGTSQNQGPTSFGQPYQPNQNNAWSNPHLGQSQPGVPGSQPPHIGFKEHLTTPNTAAGVNSHYPHGQQSSYPGQGSGAPYPVHGANAPYPVHGANAPYPTHGANAPYPMHGVNSPYPVQHGSNVPHPVGGQSFGYHPNAPPMPGQNNFNSFSHPSQPPLGNPYSTHYAGSAYAGAGPGQPQYSPPPQMLSQPAAQPYVPGQTVIMMPGQQDSGRGLGQIFKEALVFSTVNAAVNRVINPHHHHVVETKPAETSGTAAPTTHITYNNQYFNTYPGTNATVDGATGVPLAPLANPSSFPSAPSGSNIPSIPSASPGNTGGLGGTSTSAGPGMVPGPPSIPATQGSEGNTGNNVPNNPVPDVPQYKVSDDDLRKISEELFEKQAVNLTKYVKVNLQSRSVSQFPNITDEAQEPLFIVEPQVLDYPSISVTRALYENYEFDSQIKETRTMEKRMQENLLIDTFLETNVMSRAMQWLSQQGFIDPDDFEKKDILRHIWFNQFDGSTSGFERIFTAEKYGGTDILGVQDWLYFEYQEARKQLDYMGYVDKLDLGNDAALLKLNFQMDGVIRPNATIFVGTLPELEMSLYTICFFARPNNLCPVSLGGAKFNIFTHSFRYYGNDLIDLGLPIF